LASEIPFWLRLLLAFLAVIAVTAGGTVLLVQLDIAGAPVLPALLAEGAALLLGLALARGLAARLHALAGVAGEMAAGKRGLRAPADGSGEEAVLARSLNQMDEALERQDAHQRQLLADIVHELRTPLTVIRANLEALLDGIYRPNVETIAPIHAEAQQLARLVDELRDLALAEAGQLPLQTAPTDLTELARNVLSSFATQAHERSIALELAIPAQDLPLARIDAERIRQALGNLVGNALRSTPQRGRVTVALQAERGDWLLVRVSDNGVGISPEELPYVFGRSRRNAGGAGLGVAIARQWVEAHGGQIGAESVLGQGTTFRFTVPASM
jgi:signal transduction histidine kinase